MKDADGRTIEVGDRAGGTTSGRYQDTIAGEVIKLGKGLIKIRVDRSTRDSIGKEVWISVSRVLLIR